MTKEMAHSGELVERLEKASAGSVFGLTDCQAFMEALGLPVEPGDVFGLIVRALHEGSLDAALALAERVLPGWWWLVCSSDHIGPDGKAKSAMAEIGPRDWPGNPATPPPENILADAATAPLALCIAILKATTAASQAPGGDGSAPSALECTKKDHDNEG